MKSKIFITALFLIIGIKINAQIDTLNVYLEKNQKHRTGVDLIFENESNDTILLLNRFRNLSLGGEIPPIIGICIEYYFDDKPFTFNWGELPPLVFDFSEKFIIISPKSKEKLFFNVGEFFKFPEKSDKKYEVSFLITYMFTKYNSSITPEIRYYYRTNRVIIVNPCENEKNNNQ